MKKVIALFLVVSILFSGCADSKRIDGKTYDTYGFFNSQTKKNPNIQYEVSVGNVIWSVILVETVVFPIYFLGFSLYQPISKKTNSVENIGVID
jgi:hypothetical protein